MRALAAPEATLTPVDRDGLLSGSFLDGHNSLMSGSDSNIEGEWLFVRLRGSQAFAVISDDSSVRHAD